MRSDRLAGEGVAELVNGTAGAGCKARYAIAGVRFGSWSAAGAREAAAGTGVDRG